MFTGLIERIGILSSRRSGAVLSVDITCDGLDGVSVGDSIACDGVCLTVTVVNGKEFQFDLMHETADKTLFPILPIGSKINIERAMRADTRLDGHFVQGHVDTIATITALERLTDDYRITIAIPKEFAPLIVPKGSVSVNGISLTVIEAGETFFSVGIIPHTYNNTSLSLKNSGDRIHCEFDIIGKYIQRWCMLRDGNNSKPSVTEVLSQW